jgi:hypothetical protein
MLDSTRTQQPSDRTPAAQPVLLGRISLGMVAGLLIQYGLGMTVNLYVSVPAADHGGGALTAVGRALANGPAALTVHAAFGLLLILGAASLVIRAAVLRLRVVAWLSAAGLLAIVGAAASGAAFVSSGADGGSLAMALLTSVALLCYAVNLYVLGPAHPGPARDATALPRLRSGRHAGRGEIG